MLAGSELLIAYQERDLETMAERSMKLLTQFTAPSEKSNRYARDC